VLTYNESGYGASSRPEREFTVQTIAAEELRTRLEESGDEYELVDIREGEEFADWHIMGSLNLPVYNDLKAGREESLVERSKELSKERKIVTVCRGGFMSEQAARLLGTLGYDAYSLEGGMRGWGGVWTEAPIECREGVTAIQIRRNGKGCLSYLLGVDGQAFVIDPSIDVRAYLEAAEREGLKITHVLETHVHADHLSRARELCRVTGAELIMPENGRVSYDYRVVRDGDKLQLAGLNVEVFETPGHTGESSCYLVEGELLFTGDTLFVDAVGRPDLEKGDAGAEDGAHQLFGSLQQRLLEGIADVRYFPAHHGKPIGFDRRPIHGKLGEVRDRLELLRLPEEDFVQRILASLTAKPGNHESIIAINEGKAELEQSELDLEAGPNSCAAG
jgi:glyoxylase-like metal-dependent hydrolase (beta-lactamase superfamily II)/rhodanese-related sulfurtransferase